MRGSNLNDFENRCAVYITGIVDHDYEDRPEVVTIWTEISVKSFPDRCPYGNKRWAGKMSNLVAYTNYLT